MWAGWPLQTLLVQNCHSILRLERLGLNRAIYTKFRIVAGISLGNVPLSNARADIVPQNVISGWRWLLIALYWNMKGRNSPGTRMACLKDGARPRVRIESIIGLSRSKGEESEPEFPASIRSAYNNIGASTATILRRTPTNPCNYFRHHKRFTT